MPAIAGTSHQGERKLISACLSVIVLLGGAYGVAQAELPTAAGHSSADAAALGSEVSFGPRRAVPQRRCHPNDTPETDLQGRVPRQDILSGRAAQGYNCNLVVVGRFPGQTPSTAWANLDSFRNCVYYGKQGTLGATGAGVQVLDVSDPKRPVSTETLLTPAMLDPGESLRVNAKRKLLVATGYTNNYPDASGNAAFLDIYDLSRDCRHPRLISSTDMSPAAGHEGWFSPDGMTYYMSTVAREPDKGIPTMFPVDISDPAKPRLLATWNVGTVTHGGLTTEDGARTYVCQSGIPPTDAMLVLNTKQIAKRRDTPQPRLIKRLALEDNQWCQGAYRVTYDGRPYLIQYGERSGSLGPAGFGTVCTRSEDNWANFGYPRIIDLADERHPKVVSRALLEVHLPQHCDEVSGEGAVLGLGYSAHHCSPDRLYDPTILVCSWFHAGLRVLDIRDPRRPVEIGYFNPGANAVLGTGARPVIRAERGEIWFVNDAGGFYVLRFRKGIWPFKGSARCPEFNDYYFAHYNPRSDCRTANFNGIGKPAPAARRYR
jgi:hypothetical protein